MSRISIGAAAAGCAASCAFGACAALALASAEEPPTPPPSTTAAATAAAAAGGLPSSAADIKTPAAAGPRSTAGVGKSGAKQRQLQPQQPARKPQQQRPPQKQPAPPQPPPASVACRFYPSVGVRVWVREQPQPQQTGQEGQQDGAGGGGAEAVAPWAGLICGSPREQPSVWMVKRVGSHEGTREGQVVSVEAHRLFARRATPEVDPEELAGSDGEDETGGTDDDSDEYSTDSAEDDDEDDDGEIYKMMLIVNMEMYRNGKATKMRPGKVAAQCGHATLGCFKRALRGSSGGGAEAAGDGGMPPPTATWVRRWEGQGQMKITLKCPKVETLLGLAKAASDAAIPSYLVRDAGHTQIDPGSRTVLALGPAPASILQPITGALKLYD